MSTTTPNLVLTLYDSTTDQVVTFATFRAVWGGTATTSNFYKIDTWAGTVNSAITTLQNQRGAIPVAGTFISANYYEATVSSITSYTVGMSIILSLNTTSSGTVTLNINSLGTKSLMKVDSTGTPINLTGSDLVDGRQYLFTYDGTRWLWVSANSADQIQIVGTTGNVVTVGSTNNLDGSTTPSSLISSTIHASTEKTTLSDNDDIGIADSVASYVLKRITWSNFKIAIGNALGAIINSLTVKTTPVDADGLLLSDSESLFASKSISFENVKLFIKNYYDSVTSTLTNKTLTNPIISAIVNTGTLTLPTSTDTLVGRDTTDTLTNKRITPRVTSIASSATPTINTDDCDAVTITALATAITSFTTNLSGTPVDFQKLIIRIKDNGTARAITWGTSFEAKGVTLPTTTVANKVLTIGFIYDSVSTKWGCVASAREA